MTQSERKIRKRLKVKRLYYAICKYKKAMPLDNSILMQIKTEDMNELCKRKFESFTDNEKQEFIGGFSV